MSRSKVVKSESIDTGVAKCERARDDVAEPKSPEFSELQSRPISHQELRQTAPLGVVIAKCEGFDLEQRPLISGVPNADEPLVARTTIALSQEHLGRSVVVVFEDGDWRRPIVIGTIQGAISAVSLDPHHAITVESDDGRVVLSAEREIVLRCGAATITLTKSGKVLIQGTYVSSRSFGVNRIKGGSVQIN